ncbi:hypothetical protein GGX14DRAFT_390571 [Mycena pura]|uniref:Uncharacterized protein n=1 Tax=Mycena pura TaxID=153505 RepID=A0AAD6VP60_9AGAR|nr:hypothetical protein GGX14DRAFT_390571 [Mycena pura]
MSWRHVLVGQCQQISGCRCDGLEDRAIDVHRQDRRQDVVAGAGIVHREPQQEHLCVRRELRHLIIVRLQQILIRAPIAQNGGELRADAENIVAPLPHIAEAPCGHGMALEEQVVRQCEAAQMQARLERELKQGLQDRQTDASSRFGGRAFGSARSTALRAAAAAEGKVTGRTRRAPNDSARRGTESRRTGSERVGECTSPGKEPGKRARRKPNSTTH